MLKNRKIVDIRFQLGSSFETKTVEIVWSDGEHEFYPLDKKFVKRLSYTDISTNGVFAVEG